MIIDSHQHFWIFEKEKHAWIDDGMLDIRRDFLPSDLKPIYDEHKVVGCIAVQADQSLEENDFLLKQAEAYNFIKGIIGWIDLRKQDLSSVLDHFGQFPIIKGYRHVVQAETDPLFLLRENFLNGIGVLQKRGLIYEILVFPHQLPMVLEFVRLFPNITFVLDHMAKPYIKDGYLTSWAMMMRELGKIENVHCKISGVITEADYHTWEMQQILPYLEVVLEAFGTKRIMYGSDWPVCLVAGNYGEVLTLAQRFADQLSQEEQMDFFYYNAQRIYNLKK
ncbi:amidohydrolase family protein [Maribacter sp. 4G9]|uniref:amidohydrolase family protein n=1 Tax=Maribacter sp. 4G9 TaxID=1889777 RepID=UPI000C15A478|nr:amidohydrolase family protein [Maribacter sp. 4G9]PIB28955.1 amidohydrolase [Maribacter sp. 4G9]